MATSFADYASRRKESWSAEQRAVYEAASQAFSEAVSVGGSGGTTASAARVTLEVLGPDAIDSRLRELLARVRMTLEELRQRADIFALTPSEQGVLDQIEDLEYLRR